MKPALILAALLAAPSAHAAYGWQAQNSANACFVQTAKEAASGDFSHWVLPQWVPGTHFRAGQWVDENCQVKP